MNPKKNPKVNPNAFVGYLQATVSLLHLPQGIIETQGKGLCRYGKTRSQKDNE